MALTIYKISSYLTRRGSGTFSGGGSSTADFSLLLSNYYTKNELQTSGSASIHFDNITDAYHNNLLGLEGGIVADNSSGESSGEAGEYYHLSYYDYDRLTFLNFSESLVEDINNIVTLVNDETSPGNSMYYGTDGGGTKGYFALTGDSLWEEIGGDIITPSASGGVGIEVDGIRIQNYIIDAQDGSLKHLTITAGDASGAVGTGAGDLTLKAGDSLSGDVTSPSWVVYITPGNQGSIYGYGRVDLGGPDYAQIGVLVSVVGTESDINLALYNKGSGSIQLGYSNNTGDVAIFASSMSMRTNVIYIGIPTVDPISPVGIYAQAGFTNGNKGQDIYITAGAGCTYDPGDADGGNLYLSGGASNGAGTTGKIYIGTGSAGTNPLAGSGTGT